MLSKHRTEKLIKQFWRQKEKKDSSRGKLKRLSVDEFMYYFLKKKFGTIANVVDWGYNLLDAALKFKYDADCEVFLRVLTKELDESVYWDRQQTMTNFVRELQKLDKREHLTITGELPKHRVTQALKDMFPLKTRARMAKIKRSLKKEASYEKGKDIEYARLFAEDENFNQGPFAEMILDQLVAERDEYLEDLKAALKDVSRSSDDEDPELTAEEIDIALRWMDPGKSGLGRQTYLCRGFDVSKDEIVGMMKHTIKASEFMVNLSHGVVKTSSKRDEMNVVSLESLTCMIPRESVPEGPSPPEGMMDKMVLGEEDESEQQHLEVLRDFHAPDTPENSDDEKQ
eukprot:TRINITY_DN2388_c0_g3_i1.p1 TRINITY_DN2388_c0_g3~~TRINITY_DN2388_c0_g3_i1.p1  ORF type:complete len:342 (-),score=98.38 TRINITY_DN2388_c0_g3_i1:308-1333(-)